VKKINIAFGIGSILISISLLLSACQSATPDPLILQQTLQSAVEKTLTAAPTNTLVPSPTNTPEPTFTPTPARIQYGPTGFPADVNPLTGLKVANPAILDRRPVMIKVANFPRTGRPHAGLSSADIVFDYYTGLGTNRFLALYYGTDSEKVGPVRSGRRVDRWLVGMYQGILGMETAWGPVREQIISYLGNRVIATDHCPALCSDGPLTEISRFANTAEMSIYYASKSSSTNTRQNLDGMVFDSTAPSGGVTGQELTIHYGNNNEGQWKYDAVSGKYLRWIDDVSADNKLSMIPLLDRNTGQQLAFSNLVMILAENESLSHEDTDYEIHIDNVRVGTARVFRNGNTYDVTYKSGVDKPIQFFDKDKNPFALQPGNTWINILGNSSIVDEPQPGIWNIQQRTP
jgi:hypothetical protein